MAWPTKEQRAAKIHVAATNVAKTLPHPKFYFIEDDYNGVFRIWKNTNYGDQFACLPYHNAGVEIKAFVNQLCREYPETFVYGNPPEEDD